MKQITISPEKIHDNVFQLLRTDWMLVTAGTIESFNTMTASWGGLGVLWHKDVCYIFVRPNRYTYEFLESSDTFTLSFLHEKYRNVLKFCGSKSGRDVDKIKETGITPLSTERGSVYFSEARMVIECKKIYYQDINPNNFLNGSIEELYPEKDYHRMYVGEVLSVIVN